MNEHFAGSFPIDEARTFLSEYILTKMLDRGLVNLNKLLRERSEELEAIAYERLTEDEYKRFSKNYRIQAEEDFVVRNIVDNIQRTSAWCSEVSFSLAKQSKELNRVFVDIDVYLAQLKTRIELTEEIETVRSSQLLNFLDKNLIIYGGPGAGKTTLVKQLCTQFINSLGSQDFSTIIVIRFRELLFPKESDRQIEFYNLFQILLNTLGITIQFPIDESGKLRNEYLSLQKLAVFDFFTQCKTLIVFDGFDEIPNLRSKQIIERDFQEFSIATASRFIITSRNGDFKTNLSNTSVFELCPLNDSQILELATKWLNDIESANKLFEKIKSSPYYDTTIRPLTLAHLCAIYERRKSIPSKPRYIYDLVIQLLLESWDEQRGITRPSNYAEFYIEKKKEFLAHMSFYFSYHLKKTQFTGDDIKKCYNKIAKVHSLPISQSKKVVNEIESHSGILVQSGFDSFQFSHKSLQEYLTAKHLLLDPNIPPINVIESLPSEFAIVVSMSSNPNSYFYTFHQNINLIPGDFWNVFLTRIVEEKPDFTDDPVVVVFLLNMMQGTKSNIFTETFVRLVETTNLPICFPTFLRLYRASQNLQSDTTYNHRQMNKPLASRNGFPGRLIVNRGINFLITGQNGSQQ